MPKTLQGIPELSVGDVDFGAVDMQDYLDPGETFTGTPTVVESGTADLTISNKSINTSTKLIEGRTVPVGMAIQFNPIGQLSNKTYKVHVTAVTSAGRTVNFYVKWFSV